MLVGYYLPEERIVCIKKLGVGIFRNKAIIERTTGGTMTVNIRDLGQMGCIWDQYPIQTWLKQHKVVIKPYRYESFGTFLDLKKPTRTVEVVEVGCGLFRRKIIIENEYSRLELLSLRKTYRSGGVEPWMKKKITKLLNSYFTL